MNDLFIQALLNTAIGGLGPQELIIVLLIIVLLFGAKKIPELGKSVGQGLSNFKKGLREAEEEDAEAERQKALTSDKSNNHSVEEGAKKQSSPS